MDRFTYFDRATRDELISRLPVKDRVARVLQAADRLALDAVARLDSDALVEGQVLAARIPLRDLLRVTGRCEDTVRRSLDDAAATPFLDVETERGRAALLWIHWPAILAAQPPAAPPATCGGSRAELRGVSVESAGGGTSQTPKKHDPPHHPPQFPRDREKQINHLREIRALCDREHGARMRGVSECRFFTAEASDLLPWQRLNDDDLRTLDVQMLGVLYAEAVARNWLPDTHDSRRNFLAIAYHCARHRKINTGDRTRYFVGRIKKRNRLGLMDAAWDWASEQLDIGRHPRGAGAHLDAAVKAKRAAC